ncbi:hypothetical protein HMPREF1521_1684 [Veillonella sp. AS16]|nr:hypothetical protein HMPREF1521_1684 [Veillonella sp. AS16]
MIGESHSTGIPFLLFLRYERGPMSFVDFIEIDHTYMKTIYTVTPCVF